MSTCRRLHYVSKVCLRLIRKYTNEIYPNDSPKIEKPLPKRPTSDGDDAKNDPQICKKLRDARIELNVLHNFIVSFQMF